MKAIEQPSNTANLQPVNTIRSKTIKFTAKPFCLTLITGASLIYTGPPAHAEERRIETPSMETGKIQEQAGSRKDSHDTESRRGTSPHMNKGTSSTDEPVRRDTTFDTEKMNKGSAPDTENINKDTVSPGGDNMMRDAIPGGSGLNRK
ncbi:hypothetical protein [Candidatus Methylomicrobium oryzae]|jgi:hypothetical protein|uniref:hypothetical protein n=1 Tax=Candidatus Methylomicrobium oryzae TaxID=2802053 RepID=UPI0019226C28|nr:hypothetical protein [Methylomicrobium sp. RS1]MBL1264242.1 hypothetical protein [Methylomicrobium sp. RS1]